MSYLNSYRINFFGGMSANVCTANNDDVDKDKIYVDPIAAKLGPYLIDKTDEEAYSILQTRHGGWNPNGDYATLFHEVEVTSCGQPGRVSRTVGPIGASVYLLPSLQKPEDLQSGKGSAILVDVNSTGDNCTQLIVGGIEIRRKNGEALLTIHQNVLACTSFSGTQAVGGPEGNTFWNLSFEYKESFEADKSWQYDKNDPAINDLMAEVKKNKGVCMNLSVFQFQTKSPKKHNNPDPEKSYPAWMYVIGTIGVWKEGEFASCPSGRFMMGSDDNGGIYFNVDEKKSMISFNMSMAFKIDPRKEVTGTNSIAPPPNSPRSMNLVMYSGIQQFPIFFSPDTYHLFGGIVDALINQNHLQRRKNNSFTIINDQTKTVLFTEHPGRIESDDRGIYLEKNSVRTTLKFRYSEHGVPKAGTYQLEISLKNGSSKPNGSSKLLNSTYGQKLYGKPNMALFGPNRRELVFDTNLSTRLDVVLGSDGMFELDVAWKQAGLKTVILALTPKGSSVVSADYFMVIRSYPDDDYSKVDEKLRHCFDYVYQEVLRYYYVVFPAMNQRIPLNQKDVVNLNWQNIKLRTGPTFFGTTLQMPITRDMSPGKRKLLHDYLDHVGKNPG